jgi:tight adherence protein B
MSFVLLCTAAALLVWPAARSRIAVLMPDRPPRRSRLDPRWLLVFAALPVVALLGPAGTVGATFLTFAGWRQLQTRKRAKTELAAATALAEALRTTVAELRSGAPPATAAEAAAADAPPGAAATMQALATSARFGVELPRGAGAAGQVAKAWTLSRRHGLPLADLLDAVRRDVVANTRFSTRADANMAGPRASAAVLAFLPGIGVLLGEATGARPLHVLFGTSAGHVLLMLGSVLVLAGVTWTSRLTRLEVVR